MTNPDVMIPVPFAQNGLKNPINVTRQPDQDAQDATWDAGFPPVTMQRKEVGGKPPNGLDFNGVLYAVSADANHRQKGLSVEFNQDFATAIGGYPVGATLRLTNGAYVESTVAGNTNNPNSNMTGWTPYVVDNLTTDNPHRPVSAKQAKKLQDEKLDANKRGAVSGVASLDENKKVPVAELPIATSSAAGVMKLINDLTTGGTDAALTAEMGRLFFNMFSGGSNYFKIPNPARPDKPWIVQFGLVSQNVNTVVSNSVKNTPIAFPNEFLMVIGSKSDDLGENNSPSSGVALAVNNKSSFLLFTVRSTGTLNSSYHWLGIGY